MEPGRYFVLNILKLMRQFLIPACAIAVILLAFEFVASRGKPPDVGHAATNPTSIDTTRRAVEQKILDAPKARRASLDNETQRLSWVIPMFDRQLSAAEKAEDMSPDLIDAIIRIEGIFDPTRIPPFGSSLRMTIRPGTASMNNVFADRWIRADTDPNVHYRTRYMADAWLHFGVMDHSCDAFDKYRPIDSALYLEMLSPSDCERLTFLHESSGPEPIMYTPIAVAFVSVPVFAAPYPGGRLSAAELKAALEARRAAALDRLWFRAYRR